MAIISEQKKILKKNNKLLCIHKNKLILYNEKELNNLPNVKISSNFYNIKLNEQVISDIVFDGTVDIDFSIRKANNVKQFKIMLKSENEEYMNIGVVEFVSDVYSYSYSLPFIADIESKYYITCESEDGLQGKYSEKIILVKLDSDIILDENNHIIFDEHDNALIDEH